MAFLKLFILKTDRNVPVVKRKKAKNLGKNTFYEHENALTALRGPLYLNGSRWNRLGEGMGVDPNL